MTVEGLHNWPQWRVTAKHNERVYGSILIVAPTGKDAVEGAKKQAAQQWGWPDQLVWNCKRAGRGMHSVVQYV